MEVASDVGMYVAIWSVYWLGVAIACLLTPHTNTVLICTHMNDLNHSSVLYRAISVK